MPGCANTVQASLGHRLQTPQPSHVVDLCFGSRAQPGAAMAGEGESGRVPVRPRLGPEHAPCRVLGGFSLRSARTIYGQIWVWWELIPDEIDPSAFGWFTSKCSLIRLLKKLGMLVWVRGRGKGPVNSNSRAIGFETPSMLIVELGPA